MDTRIDLAVARPTPIRWISHRCVVWLTIAILLSFANDAVLRFGSSRNALTRVNYLRDCPTRHDRTAILGSSMLANAVAAKSLSERLNGETIQLALGGQGVQEQALIWDLYCERHRCDLLVLEVHDDSLMEGSLPTPLREDRYATYLDDPLIHKHLVQYSGPLRVAVWRYVPMWVFAEFSSTIGWQDWVGYLKGNPYDPNAPALYATSPVSSIAGFKPQSVEQQALEEKQIDPKLQAAFQMILDTAANTGTRVLLVEPPRYGKRLTSKKLTTSERRGFASPALVAGTFHFSKSLEMNAANFDDIRHAGKLGSERFTVELADACAQALK